MRRLILGLLTLAALSGQLNAQVTTTTVTATVLDPNKVPYANGRGTATHVSGPNSTGRNVGQVPFSMDANGTFTIRLLSNIGGGQWRFDICTPSVGTVSNCFNLTLTITGASQDISAALNAASAPMESAPFDGINAAFTVNKNFGDYFGISPPPNPLAGYYRLYVNSGTGLLECKQASGATCLPAGSGLGSVTSVALTGPGGIFSVSGSPVTSTGTFGLTLAGNSGGITYFANGTTLASSATLTANTYIKGGGAGAAPSPGTIFDDGSNPVQSPNGFTVLSNGYYYQIANANPGTSTNLLVCRNSIGRAITCATGTNHAVAGVAGQGAGNAGNVQVCIVGSCTVTFDNQSVVNDTAIPSPTVAGQVHDTGSMAQPAGVQSFLVTGTNAGVGTPTTIDVITPDSGTTGGFNNPMTTLCDEIVGGVAGAAVRLPCPTAVAGVPQLQSSTPSGGIGQTKVWAPVGIIPRFSGGPTDTVAAADRAQIIDYTAATTVTIPQAGTTGFAGNYFTCVQVDKASLGNVSFTPTVSLLDGNSVALTLGPGQGTCFFTNNTNWFSRSTNIAAVNDLSVLGPNPWYDLRRYGLYQGGAGPITCSITATTALLTCSSPGDFVAGQGIEIPLAGPASSFPAWGTTAIDQYYRVANVATYHVSTASNVIVGPPQTITIAGLADATFNGTFTITSMDGDQNHFTAVNVGGNVIPTAGAGTGTLTSAAVVVTPSGILNGSTRYDYKVVMEDVNGALSAASPAGTTLTGATTLGTNTVSLTGCARTNGIITCTAAATHNFQADSTVSVNGTSNGGLYDGEHQILTVPTATTFTYDATGQANDTNPPTGGTATVIAKNTLQWNMQQNRQLKAFIYRSYNSGAYSLAGITEGMDGSFVDWNSIAAPVSNFIPTQASYISTSTPTAVALNGPLAARIQSISGNTLTLAGVTATATVASQPAAHDNSPVVIAGCTAIAGGNGNLYIPNGGPVVFNSILNLRDNCAYPGTVNKLKILVNGAQLLANETIIYRPKETWLESIGSGGPTLSFAVGSTSEITGNAYPLIYIPLGSGPNTTVNFLMDCYRAYQSCVVEDQDSGKAGTVSTNYPNTSFNGVGGSQPFIARGGAFWHRWHNSVFTSGSGLATQNPLLITVPNALGASGGGLILGGNMQFDHVTFTGRGALFEAWGIGGQSTGLLTFDNILAESMQSPLVRFHIGNGNVSSVDFISPAPSDSVAVSTPVIEMGGAAITNLHFTNPYCGTYQPLFADAVGGIDITGFCGGPNAIVGALNYKQDGYNFTSTTVYNNASVGLIGNGYYFTQMANPAAVVSLAQSAGGSIANGTHYYSIVAVDSLNNPTLPSQQVLITTTGGNGTVTLTPPTLPSGAVGYRVYRNDGPSNITGVLDVCAQLTTPITGVFVDTIAAPCGNSAPTVNLAGTTIMNKTGYYGPTITILPTLFANLGTPANGTLYFCPDCTVASPCAGSGTGALAKRLNGAWVCN